MLHTARGCGPSPVTANRLEIVQTRALAMRAFLCAARLPRASMAAQAALTCAIATQVTCLRHSSNGRPICAAQNSKVSAQEHRVSTAEFCKISRDTLFTPNHPIRQQRPSCALLLNLSRAGNTPRVSLLHCSVPYGTTAVDARSRKTLSQALAIAVSMHSPRRREHVVLFLQ